MSLPHITNQKAGVNKYEFVATNLFDVYFTVPQALRDQGFADEQLLSEHVMSIGGLGTLDKTPATVEQKNQGVTRTYMGNTLDGTSHELTVKLTLNLRDAKDNYVYKLFKAWNKLNYDIATGAKALKVDYCADWLQVCIANRVGDVIRKITYKDVILTQLTGFDELNQDTNDPLECEVHFKSDYAEDEDA